MNLLCRRKRGIFRFFLVVFLVAATTAEVCTISTMVMTPKLLHSKTFRGTAQDAAAAIQCDGLSIQSVAMGASSSRRREEKQQNEISAPVQLARRILLHSPQNCSTACCGLSIHPRVLKLQRKSASERAEGPYAVDEGSLPWSSGEFPKINDPNSLNPPSTVGVGGKCL